VPVDEALVRLRADAFGSGRSMSDVAAGRLRFDTLDDRCATFTPVPDRS
jgi:hypothetical protein